MSDRLLDVELHTKNRNAAVRRTNKMFDRPGQAQVLYKLDLKAGFH